MGGGPRGAAIVDATESKWFLGAIGLSPQGPHRVEIGFWIVPAARGRGIATEATRLLGRWVLRDLGFDRLELLHLVGNEGSRRVAEKVGFRHEGTLRDYAVVRGEARDVVMYSLLAADLDCRGGRPRPMAAPGTRLGRSGPGYPRPDAVRRVDHRPRR